jgi:hypothetical protein
MSVTPTYEHQRAYLPAFGNQLRLPDGRMKAMVKTDFNARLSFPGQIGNRFQLTRAPGAGFLDENMFARIYRIIGDLREAVMGCGDYHGIGV